MQLQGILVLVVDTKKKPPVVVVEEEDRLVWDMLPARTHDRVDDMEQMVEGMVVVGKILQSKSNSIYPNNLVATTVKS